jgi:N-acetylglucosaminyldiphosphoundecaprenol N-acetyl-beta-D-mannosaminyltransferase
MYHVINLFDLDFISARNHEAFLEQLIDYRHQPNYGQKLPIVITPNADQIIKLDKPQYHTLKERLSQALFILPDGESIILFSRLIRKPLLARLTGSDLFPLLWQQAKQQQEKILVIVSEESVGIKLKQDYENIVYYTPPFFQVNSVEFDKICTDNFNLIKKFNPKYVIIGVGFPKQEFLGLALHAKLQAEGMDSPLLLFLGASAEFYVGIKTRAPRFLQKLGLEWLHRLLLEPRRMWRRYLLGMGSLFFLYIKEFRNEFAKTKSVTKPKIT